MNSKRILHWFDPGSGILILILLVGSATAQIKPISLLRLKGCTSPSCITENLMEIKFDMDTLDNCSALTDESSKKNCESIKEIIDAMKTTTQTDDLITTVTGFTITGSKDDTTTTKRQRGIKPPTPKPADPIDTTTQNDEQTTTGDTETTYDRKSTEANTDKNIESIVTTPKPVVTPKPTQKTDPLVDDTKKDDITKKDIDTTTPTVTKKNPDIKNENPDEEFPGEDEGGNTKAAKKEDDGKTDTKTKTDTTTKIEITTEIPVSSKTTKPTTIKGNVNDDVTDAPKATVTTTLVHSTTKDLPTQKGGDDVTGAITEGKTGTTGAGAGESLTLAPDSEAKTTIGTGIPNTVPSTLGTGTPKLTTAAHTNDSSVATSFTTGRPKTDSGSETGSTGNEGTPATGVTKLPQTSVTNDSGNTGVTDGNEGNAVSVTNQDESRTPANKSSTDTTYTESYPTDSNDPDSTKTTKSPSDLTGQTSFTTVTGNPSNDPIDESFTKKVTDSVKRSDSTVDNDIITTMPVTGGTRATNIDLDVTGTNNPVTHLSSSDHTENYGKTTVTTKSQTEIDGTITVQTTVTPENATNKPGSGISVKVTHKSPLTDTHPTDVATGITVNPGSENGVTITSGNKTETTVLSEKGNGITASPGNATGSTVTQGNANGTTVTHENETGSTVTPGIANGTTVTHRNATGYTLTQTPSNTTLTPHASNGTTIALFGNSTVTSKTENNTVTPIPINNHTSTLAPNKNTTDAVNGTERTDTTKTNGVSGQTNLPNAINGTTKSGPTNSSVTVAPGIRDNTGNVSKNGTTVAPAGQGTITTTISPLNVTSPNNGTATTVKGNVTEPPFGFCPPLFPYVNVSKSLLSSDFRMNKTQVFGTLIYHSCERDYFFGGGTRLRIYECSNAGIWSNLATENTCKHKSNYFVSQ